MHLDQTYHIYNHANGNDNLFVEAKNYSFFLDQGFIKYHQQPIDPKIKMLE